ncbi:methyltransferase domain-containing protein [Streptomyces sp. M19]
MLCRFAARYGTRGTGVDLSRVFLADARARAEELGVADRVGFERAEAAAYAKSHADGAYDVVSCLGATWIGGGLAGTLDLIRPTLRPGGTVLVGEPYWTQEPPPEALEAFGAEPDDFADLSGTNERFEAAGFELVEMVLADQDSWDRYTAPQWRAISDWLRAHPDDPDAPDMREFLRHARTSHLAYGRRYLGWGVFVLR